MISSLVRMRSSECGWDLAESGWDLADCGWDLAEWLKRLTANAKVAFVLGSIPASSDTVESEGWQMNQCWIKYGTQQNPRKSLWTIILTIFLNFRSATLLSVRRDLRVSFCITVREQMASPCFALVQYPRLNGGWSGPREASLRVETQPGRRKLSSSETFNLFCGSDRKWSRILNLTWIQFKIRLPDPHTVHPCWFRFQAFI